MNTLNNLIENSEYDKEILIYGLKVIVYNFLTVFIVLLIAYLLNNLLYGILFISSFCYLRVKIGGFHCKTMIMCMLTFNTLFTTSLLLSYNSAYCILVHALAIPSIIYLYLIFKSENNKPNTLFFMYLLIILFTNKYIFIPIFSGVILSEMLYFMKHKNNYRN